MRATASLRARRPKPILDPMASASPDEYRQAGATSVWPWVLTFVGLETTGFTLLAANGAALPASSALLAAAGIIALGIVCLGISLVCYIVNVRDEMALEAEFRQAQETLKLARAESDALMNRFDARETGVVSERG